jgi:hypothetical protein
MTNLEKLAQYYYNEDNLSTIKFDKHGRPYIQNNGRIMLSRRTEYSYSFAH